MQLKMQIQLEMENSLNFNVSSSVPEVEVGGDSRSDVDRTTKKVHFKDGIVEENNDMLTESSPVPSISWKDKLLGVNTDALNKNGLIHHEDCTDEELDFLEGDVHRSIVNGIPSINFSERIQKILFKEMELTVVLNYSEEILDMGLYTVVFAAFGARQSHSISWILRMDIIW